MKIAIPLAGGRLAEHFGHCEQFALIEADPNGIEVRAGYAAAPVDQLVTSFLLQGQLTETPQGCDHHEGGHQHEPST